MSILQARHCPHCGGMTYHRLKSRYRCRFTPCEHWECVSCAKTGKVRSATAEDFSKAKILKSRP